MPYDKSLKIQFQEYGRGLDKHFMKTKTLKRTPKAKQLAQAQELFLDSVNQNGSNNTVVTKFMAIMETLTKNHANYSIYDCFYYAKAYGLNIDEVKDLFIKFTDKEIQLERLQKIDGCYSFPIYKVVSTASFVVNNV